MGLYGALSHTMRGESVAENRQRLGFGRLEASNSNSFFNTAGTADSTAVVGVDLDDRPRTIEDRFHFVGGVVLVVDVDIVTDFEFVADALVVFSHETEVDLGLAVLLKGNDVSNNWDVKEHIPVKDKRARRVIAKGRVCSAAGGVHCSSKGFFDEFLGSIFGCRWLFPTPAILTRYHRVILETCTNRKLIGRITLTIK